MLFCSCSTHWTGRQYLMKFEFSLCINLLGRNIWMYIQDHRWRYHLSFKTSALLAEHYVIIGQFYVTIGQNTRLWKTVSRYLRFFFTSRQCWNKNEATNTRRVQNDAAGKKCRGSIFWPASSFFHLFSVISLIFIPTWPTLEKDLLLPYGNKNI
jgi:hypothetical protein